MSYTVLARRYRSGTFDEVIGQDHVAQTLKKAIAAGRIAHAFLFCGTRGVGKTSMARILAKALNCHASDAPTTEPCGKCDSCTAVSRGDDIDVIEIDAASNTGVDNVREVIENSQYRPARSRFKVYIIDEAHMLSKQAFNALLKTLEEPPSHVKFILATTEAEKLLPTILSRCQRYDFRNIPTREIAEHLAEICKKEKVKADEEAVLLVAKAGAGSMRDSLSLLDRLLSVGERTLTADMIEQMLGLPRGQMLFELAGAIGAGDVKSVLSQANAIVNSGLSVDSLLAALVDHLRNLLIIRTCGADSTLVEAPGVAMKELSDQAARFDIGALSQDIAVLEELRRTLRQTQAGRALLDATLVRLTLADQFASIGELLARMDGAPTAAPASSQKKNDVANHVAPASALPHGEAIRRTIEDAAENTLAPVTDVESSTNSPSPGTPGEGRVRVSQTPSTAAAPEAEPAPAEAAAADDDNDDLPSVGRVWTGGSSSLSSAFAKSRAQSPAAVSTPTIAPVAAPNVDLDVNSPPAVMRAMLDQLSTQIGLYSVMSQCELATIAADHIVVRYGPQQEAFIKAWDKNGKKDAIRSVASRLLNRAVALKFELSAEVAPAPVVAPPPRPTAAAQPSRPGAQQAEAPATPEAPTIRVTPELVARLASETPLINEVMKKLGGHVVKVE